jgi:hypothetical protein
MTIRKQRIKKLQSFSPPAGQVQHSLLCLLASNFMVWGNSPMITDHIPARTGPVDLRACALFNPSSFQIMYLF